MGKRGTGTGGDIRRAILAAAKELFLAPDYSPFGNLSLDRIAEHANVSRSTLTQHFGDRQGLMDELTRFLLREGHDLNEEAWAAVSTQMLATIRDTDRSAEDLGAMVTRQYIFATEDPSFRVQMALWPYAERDESVRTSLVEMFKVWDDGVGRVLLEFFDENVGLISRRHDWLSISEMAVLTSVIVEGIAIRRAVFGANEVPDDLAARSILALISTMFVFVDMANESTIDMFARLDALRAARDSG